MSHNLKIETGGVVYHERPKCVFEAVQVENHILIEYRITQGMRLRYMKWCTFKNLHRLFCETDHRLLLCQYVYEILNYYT